MRSNLGRTLVTTEWTTATARSKRPTLFATNYGVLGLRDAYGALRPRAGTLIFQGDHIIGPWLTMEVLVLAQRLNVGFSADGLDPSFWTDLATAVRRHLTDASGHPSNR